MTEMQKQLSAAKKLPDSSVALIRVDRMYLSQFPHHRGDIPVDQNRPFFDLTQCACLPHVDAGVGGLRVARRHAEERIFDDDRRVVADAEL